MIFSGKAYKKNRDGDVRYFDLMKVQFFSFLVALFIFSVFYVEASFASRVKDRESSINVKSYEFSFLSFFASSLKDSQPSDETGVASFGADDASAVAKFSAKEKTIKVTQLEIANKISDVEVTEF